MSQRHGLALAGGIVAAAVSVWSPATAQGLPPPPPTPHTVPASQVVWSGRFACPGLPEIEVEVATVRWKSVSVAAVRVGDRELVDGLPEFNASLAVLTHLNNFQVLCSEGYAVLMVKGFIAGSNGGDVRTDATIGPTGLLTPIQTRQ